MTLDLQCRKEITRELVRPGPRCVASTGVRAQWLYFLLFVLFKLQQWLLSRCRKDKCFAAVQRGCPKEVSEPPVKRGGRLRDPAFWPLDGAHSTGPGRASFSGHRL